MYADPRRRFPATFSSITLEGRVPGQVWKTSLLCPGQEMKVQSGMKSENRRNSSTNRKASAEYTAEQREQMRRGLRILARIIARAHLRRQASLPGVAAEDCARDEGR